jgi:protein subunit release factor A
MTQLPDGYQIPNGDDALLRECDVQVFRATGPGGQGVNTTDSAVRLTHRPSGIVIVARRERSQLRNKHDALERLRARLIDAQRVRARRVPTKPGKGAIARRLSDKKQLSAKKSVRRKPIDD